MEFKLQSVFGCLILLLFSFALFFFFCFLFYLFLYIFYGDYKSAFYTDR